MPAACAILSTTMTVTEDGMTEVKRDGNCLWVTDDNGRTLGAHIVDETGSIMFTQPSGTPGLVKKLAEMSYAEACVFAHHILALRQGSSRN